MSDEIISMFAHADHGALVFNSREDLMLGSKIECFLISKWGLTLHVGHDEKI